MSAWIGAGLVFVIGQAIILGIWLMRSSPLGKFAEHVGRLEASAQMLHDSNERLIHELKAAKQSRRLADDEALAAQVIDSILRHRDSA